MLKSAVRTVKATASEARAFKNNARTRAAALKAKEEEEIAWALFEEAQIEMDRQGL